MTREHVFSDWLQRIIGPMESQTEGTPGEVTRGLFKVKDVCARCNNGPLSRLDDYAKKLWRKFFHELDPPPRTRFQADFHELTRYLLKTAYNDARKVAHAAKRSSTGASREAMERIRLHQHFADYILGVVSQPPYRVDIVAGTRQGPVHPSVGAGDVPLVGAEQDTYLTRWVHIGAFSFVVNAWKAGVSDEDRNASLRSLRETQGWVPLPVVEQEVELVHVGAPNAAYPLRFVDPGGKEHLP